MLFLLTIRQYYYREKKINLLEEIKAFYKTHQNDLENAYPGLNLNILKAFFRDDLKLSLDKIVSSEDLSKITNHLLKAVPFAYIAKEKHFYELELFIDERVLIPRFETEILVDEAIKLIKTHNLKSIIDIGTGSGAIILNILKNCELDYALATDISKDAMEVCKYNYNKLKNMLLTKSCEFRITDRFSGIDEKFDLIISNPPYIKKQADKDGVHFQTDKFEPHIALYLDDEVYDAWFDDFFREVSHNLNENGFFMMEGHEDHMEDLASLSQKYFSNCESINDLTGTARFLKLYRKE